MSVVNYRIRIFLFIKYYVSVHHHNIYTGLENITPMFLSIMMKVRFVFNAWMVFRDKNYPDENGIYSLMQWLQLLNIRQS